MLTYKYTVRDTKSNAIIKDTLSAASEKEAVKILITQGFSVISVKEDRDSWWAPSDKIPVKQRIIFTRQLSALVNSGLPIRQSLRTIEEQASSKRLKRVIQIIISDVESGKSLAQAFARWPKVFSQIYVAIVAAGEVAGTLDRSLARLADQQDKDAEIISKVKGAMVYPAIVVFVIVAVVIFLLMTVMPQVKQLYVDLGEELPFLTQVLVSMADFIAVFWWLIAIFVGIGVFFWLRFIKTAKGRFFWDKMKLNLPLFKDLIIKMYAARFCRTMEILLASGVHMLEAMEISSRSINNTVLEREIIRDSERVKGGKPLSVALRHEEGEGYIPLFVPQMVSIGEKSGKIDEMLAKTATYYENEVDAAIKALQQMIEPVLMVLLAFVAGIMIIAVLVPIYNLSGRTSI
jgi:type IV pilus assembly protein PilC